MNLSAESRRIVRAVMRHNGIPDHEHDQRIALDLIPGSKAKQYALPPLKVYRLIYASLTHEEKQAAQ